MALNLGIGTDRAMSASGRSRHLSPAPLAPVSGKQNGRPNQDTARRDEYRNSMPRRFGGKRENAS
ncbi:MAG: hypothetical protein JO128_02925 [Alphaproteobacteria bacterium]|nr:hypothetical protein [Alphaproteobacteria bacterium]